MSVCLSPAGHNFKPSVMKLYQVVEVVSTEKPIDFEVKGQISRSHWLEQSSSMIDVWELEVKMMSQPMGVRINRDVITVEPISVYLIETCV